MVSRVLNNIEHSLIAISIISGCISISAFASFAFDWIHIQIASSTIRLKDCQQEIKKHKAIIKKKIKKLDNILLLGKSKLRNGFNLSLTF